MDENQIALLKKMDGQFVFWMVELSPDEIIAYLMAGNIQSQKIANGIRAINKLIPTMNYGHNNSNNGHPFHKFTIGLEYSRVIYLKIIGTYAELFMKDINMAVFAHCLEKIGASIDADEADSLPETRGNFTFRFWWD